VKKKNHPDPAKIYDESGILVGICKGQVLAVLFKTLQKEAFGERVGIFPLKNYGKTTETEGGRPGRTGSSRRGSQKRGSRVTI